MMKINTDNLRTVKPVTIDELEKLHTGSLISRLKLLKSLQQSFGSSDWLPEERDAVDVVGLIAFNDSDSWENAVSDVKSILANRKHVSKGNKEERQKAAFRKQNR